MSLLRAHAEVAGAEAVDELRLLARPLQGLRLLMVNSTRRGGGVAEMLASQVPLLLELGIEVRWEVIGGDADFYRCTKAIHNGLQGNAVHLPPRLLRAYRETAGEYRAAVETEPWDVVLVHDPQPAGLVEKRLPGQTWIWRCHVDASRPRREVWSFLAPMVGRYDASVFSMPSFARDLRHRQFVIHPSIDPLSEKNVELAPEEAAGIVRGLGVPDDLPLLLQVSRFDRFKDPLGVIAAFRRVRENTPCRLVLAGGSADDDPEGAEVLAEVEEAADGEPDVHVLVLPPDAHREINALQRAADIVLQKSTREGFGLTVTEAMLKARPVIAGAVGGLGLQVKNGVNGFLVHTVPGAAHRLRYLLRRREEAGMMGACGKQLAIRQFLITRHVRDLLLLLIALRGPAAGGVRVRAS